MNAYSARDLAAAFRRVRGNTVKIAQEIPEDKYSFKAAPETRSVGRLFSHIATIPMIQEYIHQNRIDSLAKVNFMALVGEMITIETVPRTKAEIIALLEKEGERFAAYLEGLSDEFLAERVETPGDTVQTKSRFELLLSPKEHEMHHRGQLMLIQRMLGLVPHLTRQMQERASQLAAQAAQR